MDLLDAVRRAPAWEQTIYQILSGEEDALKDSIEWYDELAGSVQSPLAQLYRVILIAEDGQTNRVNTVIVPWEFQGEALARMAVWVRVAYFGVPSDSETGRALVAEIREGLPAGWFADTLIVRVASRIKDRPVGFEAESAIVMRGESLLNRLRIMVAAELALVTLGVGLLIGSWRRPAEVRIGDALVPQNWTPAEGYGLFIRGALGFLLVSVAAPVLFQTQSPLVGLSTLAAGAPMLAWTGWYLGVRRESLSQAFGLQRPAGGVARLVVVTLMVVGLSLVGEAVISLVGGALQVKVHWADDLLEDMLWGPSWVAAGVALDSIVWAPLVEEIAFRGILYGTLRTKMAVAPAVLLSAALFAGVHGYSVIGFASVCWSGILWALAYERTRSLLPGMLAHAVNNLLVTVEFVWMVRV
jgi:membrane protease YdiL (CAAX protease family)